MPAVRTCRRTVPAGRSVNRSGGILLHSLTLDNGLKVVVEAWSGYPLVALNLWYHVGSRNEMKGKTGLAHLFEHMLFEGSQHVPKNGHFEHLERVGANVNGSTWYDRTNYYETFSKEALSLSLWLESDRMGFFLPSLTEEKLNNQREVVKNERRWRVENRPYGLWDERLFEMAFPPEHPYHHPVIGYMEDLETMDMEDVRAFFQAYYAPNNCTLTLAGGVDMDDAVDEVRKYFDDIPPSELPAPPSATPVVRANHTYETLKDRVKLPKIFLLYPLPSVGSPECRMAEVASTLLTRGVSSRLYRRVIMEYPIAVEVTSRVYPLELGSAMIFILTLKKDTDPHGAIESFDAVLAELSRTPPGEEEFKKAVAQVRRRWLSELDNLTDRADMISMGTTLFQDPSWAFSEADRVSDVSRSSLLPWVHTYVDSKKRATLTFLPEDDRE